MGLIWGTVLGSDSGLSGLDQPDAKRSTLGGVSLSLEIYSIHDVFTLNFSNIFNSFFFLLFTVFFCPKLLRKHFVYKSADLDKKCQNNLACLFLEIETLLNS